VEDHGGGVAEQRGGDAQPLGHAEGELARRPGCHRPQAGRVDDLIDAGPADAAGLREREQMMVGAAGRMDRPGVQQPPHLAQRRGVRPGRAPVWALAVGIVTLWLDGPLEGRCVSLGTTPEELSSQIAALLETLLTRGPTPPGPGTGR